MCWAIPNPWFSARLSVFRISISSVPGRKSAEAFSVLRSPIDYRYLDYRYEYAPRIPRCQYGFTYCRFVTRLGVTGGETTAAAGATSLIGHGCTASYPIGLRYASPCYHGILPMQIEKVYEPQRFEPHWAQWWIDSGIFRADAKAPGRVFSLVIPPPNVTGSLHIGHMLEHAEIDTTIRWHRMRGDNTLSLPGTDHAGIATQMVVARKLAEEGVQYRDLGRDEFEK